MDAAAEAAVGSGNDVFLADNFSERDEAIGYQFPVLDEVGGVADDAWDEDFSAGQFHVARDPTTFSQFRKRENEQTP